MTYLNESQVQYICEAIYTDLEVQIREANIKDEDEALEALKTNIYAKLSTMAVWPYEDIKKTVIEFLNINKIVTIQLT